MRRNDQLMTGILNPTDRWAGFSADVRWYMGGAQGKDRLHIAPLFHLYVRRIGEPGVLIGDTRGRCIALVKQEPVVEVDRLASRHGVVSGILRAAAEVVEAERVDGKQRVIAGMPRLRVANICRRVENGHAVRPAANRSPPSYKLAFINLRAQGQSESGAEIIYLRLDSAVQRKIGVHGN